MKKALTIMFIMISYFADAQLAITIPAEYEKCDQVVTTWSYNTSIDSVIGQISSIVSQSTDIEIIYNPDSIVSDTNFIKNYLVNFGAVSEHISFIPAVTNTCWLKQYSPVTGYGVFVDSLVQYDGNPGFSSYNQPYNDSIPGVLANFWNWNLVNYNLDFENTNIQYDGMQNLFVGENILQQNLPLDENQIKDYLFDYFGADDIVFTPYLNQSGGGEIVGNNSYMKILDFETIMVSEIPDTLPDFNKLEDFVSELSTIQDNFGGYYDIIRIPSPPNADGTYPTSQNEELRSYTSSLIINNEVFIPSFNIPEFDTLAYNIYQKYMPGYNIYSIDSRALSASSGSINALFKSVPQSSYLRILHEKNIGVQPFLSDYEIFCLSASGSFVDEMWLYYKLQNDTSYTKTEIQLVCPQHFGVIRNLSPTDTVSYYIEAISSETTVTYPLSAPQGNFTFWFDVVGVDNNIDNSNLIIYPNPSSGSFNVKSNNAQDIIEISIYNSLGQQVINKSFSPNQVISNLHLNNGYYTVVIKQNNSTKTSKLLINK